MRALVVISTERHRSRPCLVDALDAPMASRVQAEEEEKAKQRKILNTMTSTLSTWVQNQAYTVAMYLTGTLTVAMRTS